jgi:hypothetical protein
MGRKGENLLPPACQMGRSEVRYAGVTTKAKKTKTKMVVSLRQAMNVVRPVPA